MRHLENSAEHILESVTDVPCWSGVPIFMGDVMIVPLHVNDERPASGDASWKHVGFLEALEGDIEYHVYQRIGQQSLSPVLESVPDFFAPDMWGAVSIEQTAQGA